MPNSISFRRNVVLGQWKIFGLLGSKSRIISGRNFLKNYHEPKCSFKFPFVYSQMMGIIGNIPIQYHLRCYLVIYYSISVKNRSFVSIAIMSRVWMTLWIFESKQSKNMQLQVAIDISEMKFFPHFNFIHKLILICYLLFCMCSLPSLLVIIWL